MCSVVKYCGDMMSLYRSVSTSRVAHAMAIVSQLSKASLAIKLFVVLTFKHHVQIVKVVHVIGGRLHNIE